MLLTLSGRSFIKIPNSYFPLFPVAYPSRIATHYNITSCAVNDVIFLSGCESCAINLGNKNMKIGIFTGVTSVRSKNIFTAISDILPESMKWYLKDSNFLRRKKKAF